MVDLPTYPMTAYHPVHGKFTAETHEDAKRVFGTNPLDWFNTPEEADAHRTEREAGMVIHNGVRGQIELHKENDMGVIMHSVQHQETVDKDVAEGKRVADQQGFQHLTSRPETQGSELTAGQILHSEDVEHTPEPDHTPTPEPTSTPEG